MYKTTSLNSKTSSPVKQSVSETDWFVHLHEKEIGGKNMVPEAMRTLSSRSFCDCWLYAILSFFHKMPLTSMG